ncbi:hypothetical protein [Isoptericola sp. NPDC056605]|uniref:hypothetical protein n=1 Tax=Isoptericola sp. NPDC056605 TaxID=3345876 RepID=UPI0036BC03FD
MFEVTPASIRTAAFGITIPEGTTADAQLTALIAKAELRLVAAVPSVPSRIEEGTLDVELVQGVVEDMVLRVVRNPKALRSVGLDDFQATIDNSTSTGLLYVSPEETALLAPSSRSSVGSIRLGVPAWRLPGGC